jgi:hypothetical protein
VSLARTASVCGFDQRRAEPWAPAPNTIALTLAGTLVIARTDACPEGEVSYGWEAAHIRANLGHQNLGNTVPAYIPTAADHLQSE